MKKDHYPEHAGDEDDSHPTQSTHGESSPDQQLRRAGFEIDSRPKVGPAVWIRKGVKFTEGEALLRVQRDGAKK